MLALGPALNAYILVITALLGLIFGSFINCAVWRMVHGGSVLRGRSRCARCSHELSPLDLIPLLSWLLLKGKCRYCGEKISVRYPLAELITALAFISAVLKWGVSLETLMYLILACVLMAIATADLDAGIVPDRFIIAGAALFVVFNFLLAGQVWQGLLKGLLGGVCVAAPLLVIVLAADKILGRESMGGGDIKLIFMLGLFLRWKLSLMCLIFACVIGLVFALVFNKKPAREQAPPSAEPDTPADPPPADVGPMAENGPGAFPFGPAICAAGWLTLLFGQSLLGWYTGLFM